MHIPLIPAPDTFPRFFAHFQQFRFSLLDAPATLGCHLAEEKIRLPVPAPNYTVDLYVEMVGMPLVLNKMSSAVRYTY
jgi:hypothetical protein